MSAVAVLRPLRQLGLPLQALLLGLAVLGLALPDQAVATLAFVLDSFAAVGPLLLLALLVAAYARAAGAESAVARAVGGRPVTTILLAAAFGTLSPFCSCGVIPVIAALLALGMPLPAIMAFWLSSPLMDPQMFLLTAAVLGSGFALAKTLAAVAIGVLAGFVTLGLQRLGLLQQVARRQLSACGAGAVARREPPRWRFWQDETRRRRFGDSFLANARLLLPWLALAFALESLMLAYLPGELVAAAVGRDSLLAIPTAALVGVPAYLNGYAALPTVAALMELGMAKGAALAFLVAGGVTSLPAALAVHAVATRPVFVAYLVFALAGALLAGLGFQLAP